MNRSIMIENNASRPEAELLDQIDHCSPYQNTLAVLEGKKPARIPFVTRLESWYKGHTRNDTLPERFCGMSLPELHCAVGVGQLKFMAPYALKLCGVEVEAKLNGKHCFHEFEPVIENFPGMWDLVSTEQAGETETRLHTKLGSLRLRHELLQEGVFSGTDPYLKEHLIKDEDDLKIVEYILERAEYVSRYDKIAQEQVALGGYAFIVPLLHRIPFQQALLEYFGEVDLFFLYHDCPDRLRHLLMVLDEQMLGILDRLADFDWPYVEFPDNLHGLMTNPKLFREFCLPHYQKYTSILHQQGKKVGSHTDGNVKPLLALLKESGLDVCESFSPYPLTECTFSEAWEAWRGGPLIWGGIPSPILETSTTDEDFMRYIDDLFQIIHDKPLLLGVVDLFMYHNSIERVEAIAHRIDQFSQE
jgi:Uroporphyrinogen decarboxylase (URO-D)